MPIYEEKLVCPFAVRFTQDYIRTSFRDGRLIQVTLNEIKAEEAGVGDYDVILRAPFPHIEIIRWRLPRYGVGRVKSGKGTNIEMREHWFTLDNRRLYCLQRAAAALWPRRVAAVCEILYADPGTVWKKYDSSTHGWSVHLGPSATDTPTDRWDWREAVLPLEMRAGREEEPGVLEIMLADDKKRKVGDLDDTPNRPVSEELINVSDFLSVSWPKGDADQEQCPTPSTVDGSDDSDGPHLESVASPSLSPQPAPGGIATLGEKPEDALTIKATKEIEEQLGGHGNGGLGWINKWNSRYSQQLGTLREFLEKRPDKFKVTAVGKKKFTVCLKGGGRLLECVA
eukprot:CAMPEP_0179094088 /NCGR_PEP_ID=MMETSP0796-20121207/43130_1 /TAXON_ID=73915 /ORGANISM="Pyrodinium bahamense, Strain pbaha01" /LENGTH=340 /DNA_ID=CAMNT_0020791749 /DNA_START=113 /DNA_END=1135 /DNA_ORIENTATION=-